MSGKFKISEGDWICSQEGCGNINYARRTECHKCRHPRPKFAPKLKKVGSEIGRHAAKKSGGLFSAEDWQCSMCSNINWARRDECNVCGHPKIGKIEERTGIGGGFNERENVEYIKRDSDGEYDDFGRKKKKFRKPTDEIKKEEGGEVLLGSAESSSEDGDLSKYNLESDNEESNEDPSKYDLASEDQLIGSERSLVGESDEKREKREKESPIDTKRHSTKDSKHRHSSKKRRSSPSPPHAHRRRQDRLGHESRQDRDRSRSPITIHRRDKQ